MKRIILLFISLFFCLAPLQSGYSAVYTPDSIQLKKAPDKKLNKLQQKISKKIKKIGARDGGKNEKLAKNSLIISLISLGLLVLGFVVSFFFLFSIASALTGGIMGLIAYKREKRKENPSRKTLNKALGGIWVGFLSSFLTLALFVIAIIIVIAFFNDLADSFFCEVLGVC